MKNNYDDVYVYIPKSNMIIRIAEGSGDNLLKEDIEEGYKDYIYYEIYEMLSGIEEIDGGMILMKELFREKYACTEECVMDVLEFAGVDYALGYLVLR